MAQSQRTLVGSTESSSSQRLTSSAAAPMGWSQRMLKFATCDPMFSQVPGLTSRIGSLNPMLASAGRPEEVHMGWRYSNSLNLSPNEVSAGRSPNVPGAIPPVILLNDSSAVVNAGRPTKLSATSSWMLEFVTRRFHRFVMPATEKPMPPGLQLFRTINT